MMRREFITLLSGAAAVWFAWPLGTHAQQSGTVYRLGHLSGGNAASRIPLLAAFMRGMHDLGYVEGQNLVIEHRYAESRFEILPSLVQELLAWNPDALFVSTTPASLAAKAATSTVPIVMVSVADPLGVGLVASLSRPGGNVTGITNIGAELAGKRVEILKEIAPAASKVAVLINPHDQNALLQLEVAKLAADKLGVSLEPVLHTRSDADLKDAFKAAIRAGAGAALRMLDPLATALREQTVALAAEYRLPVIYPFRDQSRRGDRMKRREFISLAGGAVLGWWSVANSRAQPAKKMRRVGVLMPIAADDPEAPVRIAAFLSGLQQSGWMDGDNLRIDYRWAGGDASA